MRILLATDGSESSAAAVREIARRPFPAGSELKVISVYESPFMPMAEPWMAAEFNHGELEKAERERAHKVVETAAAELRAGGGSCQLKITTEVLAGAPKQVILDEAERFKANLIVVGSHGRGRLERFLLGSISQAVAAHAKCSVEIVRSPNAQAGEVQ